MNDQLESRLRGHLRVADTLAVHDIDTVLASSRRVGMRIRRRRRLVASLACVALVSAGAVVIWNRRAGAPSVIGTATDSVVATEVQPAPTAQSTSSSTTSTSVASTTSSATPWGDIAADPRGAAMYPSVVWTGTEALVVGGSDRDGQIVSGAAAYQPSSDTWRVLADPPAPIADPLVAWTGTEMLVIGGTQADGGPTVSAGYAYDVVTDTWRSIDGVISFVTNATPSAWTGDELLMWPSTQGSRAQAYDPSTGTWRQLADAPIAPRAQAASVWSGDEWIVWGGRTTGTDDPTEVADGAAYDPATDSWRLMATSPLSKRRGPGVWTGTEMIVDAGSVGGDRVTGNGMMALSDGAAYDPITDTWRSITSGPAHPGFVPVWTGTQMVMFAKGGAVVYDVAADQWIDGGMSDPDTGGTASDSPIWTGSTVLLVGSFDGETGGVTFTPAPATS
jgi:hypothetical protein